MSGADAFEADVCIVGAGYAGLVAARRLARRGVDVAVVEARDRVGGRTWSVALDDGTPVDLGGTWIGPTQDRAYALAADLGVDTVATYHDGDSLLVTPKYGVRRYHGLNPRIGPFGLIGLAVATLRLDRLSRRVPLDEPWSAARAEEWDSRTVGSWIESSVPSRMARDLLTLIIRAAYNADPARVSFLYALHNLRGSGGLQRVASIEGGSQQDMLDSGAGAMAQRLGDDLGDALRLSSPTRAIVQRGDFVRVSGAGYEVRCRRAIVAVPLTLTNLIDWDPALPAERATLADRAPAGQVIKTVVAYTEPFWRAAGLGGDSAATNSPVDLTLDATKGDGTGVLMCFTCGPNAERLAAMPGTDRRAAVLGALRERFGVRAASPAQYLECNWGVEQWSRGCYSSHYGPGVLSKFGAALREPFGLLHWAGAETSPVWSSNIEGAIRSGERAAAEVLDRL